MNLWDKLKNLASQKGQKRPSATRSEQEWLNLAKQQTLHLLQIEFGLNPVFCEEFTSEFAVSARGDNTPLIFVWAREEKGNAQLIVTVTKSKVEMVMRTFLNQEDPIFVTVLNQVSADLQKATAGSLLSTMEQTGASAQEICENLCLNWG